MLQMSMLTFFVECMRISFTHTDVARYVVGSQNHSRFVAHCLLLATNCAELTSPTVSHDALSVSCPPLFSSIECNLVSISFHSLVRCCLSKLSPFFPKSCQSLNFAFSSSRPDVSAFSISTFRFARSVVQCRLHRVSSPSISASSSRGLSCFLSRLT